jgi:hypothetical protein
MKSQALALAGMLAICACTPVRKEPDVNLGGYPPAFRAGYQDGCASARRLSGTTRDEARFKSDSMYATGWRDGYDICKKQPH